MHSTGRISNGWSREPEIYAPLPLVMTGQCGEIARRFYDVGDPGTRPTPCVGSIAAATLIWPRPVLSRQGTRLLHVYLGEWVSGHARVRVRPGSRCPSSFYLVRKAQLTGSAPATSLDEYMTDITAPLWSRRLIPYEVGLSAGERARELFHFYALDALAPGLTRLPFAGVRARNGQRSAAAARYARGNRERPQVSRAGNSRGGINTSRSAASDARGECSATRRRRALERALGPSRERRYLADSRAGGGRFGCSGATHGPRRS